MTLEKSLCRVFGHDFDINLICGRCKYNLNRRAMISIFSILGLVAGVAIGALLYIRPYIRGVECQPAVDAKGRVGVSCGFSFKMP